MNRHTRELARLKEDMPVPPCEHGLPSIMSYPGEARQDVDRKLAELQKALDQCPWCSKQKGRPVFVFMQFAGSLKLVPEQRVAKDDRLPDPQGQNGIKITFLDFAKPNTSHTP